MQSRMYTCSLLLRSATTHDRALFTHTTIAETREEAMEHAAASADLATRRAGWGEWEVENSTVIEIDRDLIERAAREVLGWAPK